MANEYVIRRGLVVSGSSDLSGSLTVRGLSAGSGNLISIGANGVLSNSSFSINQSVNSGSSPSFAGLTVNGNTTVTGNLTVSGTTTFINTTDIFIKDKLVVIASGSTTSADADGGGLFISGAAASITWSNGSSRMEFNKPLGIIGAVSASSFTGTGTALTALNADNLASGTVPLARLSGITTTQLSATAGILNAQLANSSVTVGSTAISLGSSATTIAGLSSVTSTTFVGALTGTASWASNATTALATTAALTAGSYLTSGGTFNGSTARTFAVDATDANTASKIVARDASGNFSAGTILVTAVTSTTPGTILTGSFTGSFKGDGSALTGVAASFPTSPGTTPDANFRYYTQNGGGSSVYTTQTDLATGLAGQGLTPVTGKLNVNSGSMLSFYSSSTFAQVSGDISITSAGVASIGSGVIVDADINAAAAIAVSKLAANTISGVTLGGTLAALTAGSYITSGGTYTGATARTFAVDATDANTASKVVARDASGNFSAGTITAALSGNATTATTATQVGNALTAGSGLASGGTFTGAAARTFTVDSGSMAAYFSSSAFSTVSGDITITSAGVAAIGSGVIVNADINNSAAIAVSKLAASTISGITLGNNLGTLTIGDGLSGTSYNGSTGVTAAVDSTVLRTTGDQSIAGVKTFTGNIVTTGDLLISGSGVQKSIIDKQQIGPQAISTLTQVASVSATNVDAVFFDYVIKQSTTDMRAGTVMVVTNGTTAEFTETSTLDIGNTSMVILTADINAGNVRLLALSPSGTWTIRTLVRTI
jgi:hypothetical protein